MIIRNLRLACFLHSFPFCTKWRSVGVLRLSNGSLTLTSCFDHVSVGDSYLSPTHCSPMGCANFTVSSKVGNCFLLAYLFDGLVVHFSTAHDALFIFTPQWSCGFFLFQDAESCEGILLMFSLLTAIEALFGWSCQIFGVSPP